MDKGFDDCIKEIESNYVSFPKVNRIRIEKWVEKLVMSTSSNLKWRKHRDLYARYLLSLVISKRLDEPFTQLPPDGPLPSFPVEKIYKCKDLLGSRESKFWRQMYNSLTTTQSIKQNVSLNDQERNYFQRTNNYSTKLIPGQDMHNLNLIIKEQASRIELLEEKLHEERLRHEMQIRQLINKYGKQFNSWNFINRSSQTAASPTYTDLQHTSILRPSSRPNSADAKVSQPPSLGSNSYSNQNRINPTVYSQSMHVESNRSQPTTTTTCMSNTATQRRMGRPKLSDIDSGYASAAESEVTDDAISNRLKGHKKEVWIDYMQYLDKFQHEIKNMPS